MRLEDEVLLALARRLRQAETGGWTETAMRELVDGLGWEWRHRVEPPHREHHGPVLRTGLPTGEAYLRSVRRHAVEEYTEGEEYVGLYVPVDVPEDDPVAKADAFRRAADVLTGAFGPSSIMGVYGSPGPFYDSPASWGSPFRRWRGESDSLELRAGEQGPELLLQPNGPVESWHWRQSHGEPYALGGFFGVSRDPANEGLGMPGGWRTDDWDVFAHALASVLTTLPVEVRALGIARDLTHFGLWLGALHIYLSCDPALELALCDFNHTPLPEPELLALGWLAGPPDAEHLADAAYRSPAHRPGTVDGRALARLVVDTARLNGHKSPRELYLVDHSQQVGEYYVQHYGLTLAEAP
ncbi:hypothetical protein HCN51_36765 [Nonomuraea sp. FMUSA5-5]|uniref:Uncharacterized protein n=1 Tax=Nonomuraea composti TaxID=2720023 RepID=A0ABX1BEE8_9ACTN|nr:hypothetical protein [Nonomuraea sp. FMUSA5-5]NJP94925.1 hypothetical protein [Nonomuraea sp. FMUSA5-5]